jgi:hypothetical protein
MTITTADGVTQKFLVGTTSTVEHVMELLSVNCLGALEDEHALLSCYGERLKTKETVWAVLKEMGVQVIQRF